MILELPAGFEWVIASGLFSVLVLFYLAEKVSGARKVHKVEYPIMYDNAKLDFACVQRGHQNMLETHHIHLWMMTIAGFKHPIAAASLGLVWSIARVVYAHGYATGKPGKRIPGGVVSGLCLLGLLGLCVSVAISVRSA